MPKTRKRSRYSIVIVSESGTSRQVDLTTFRIRAGAIGLAGFVCLLAILFMWAGASFFGKPSPSLDEPALTAKLKALENELRDKELALAVRTKQIEEGQQPSAVRPAPTAQLPPPSISQKQAVSRDRTDDGPLTSLPAPGARGTGALLPEAREETDSEGTEKGPPSTPATTRKAPDTERSLPPARISPPGRAGKEGRIVSFNAQDVTVKVHPGNRGTISFRLVKDQHDVLFSGYLFVFVEIVDKRGQPRLYAYPDRTKVEAGDDLPEDFRAGESVSFKYNSRVELPYRDVRPGAKLSRVSILLYGEDGNIVFQRGFSSSEVTMESAKATNVTDQQPKPVRKRQAL